MADEQTNWQVVENGLDFLASAIEETAEGPDERSKYAVLHLYAAIETLVKARLARVHWALTVARIDRAKRATYLSGDFESAGAAASLARLRDIAGLPITSEHLAVVDRVGRLRNRVAHFALGDEPVESVRAALGEGLHFALWFIEHHLRPGAPADDAEQMDATLADGASALGRIDALVSARMAALKDDLAGEAPVVECARCRQPAMRLDEGMGAKCLFCLAAPAPEDAADQYVNEVLGLSQYVVVKDGGQWPVEECPDCGRDAPVEGVDVPGRPDVRWACFACGHWARGDALSRCTRCGDLTADDSEICRRCWEHIVSD